MEKARNRAKEKEPSASAVNDDNSTLNDQLVVKSYVDAIIDRTKLLLYVTMATDDPSTPLTSDYKGNQWCAVFRRIKFFLYVTEPVILSPTTGPSLLRSFSAPPPSLTKYVIFNCWHNSLSSVFRSGSFTEYTR